LQSDTSSALLRESHHKRSVEVHWKRAVSPSLLLRTDAGAAKPPITYTRRMDLVLCASAGDLGKHSCIALVKRKRDERETGLAALRTSLLSRREAISRVRDKVTR
jgi:hypothetical protein